MKTKKTKTQCWAVHFLFLDIESMVAEIWLWRSAIVLSMCGKHWVQSSYIPVQSALWFTIFHSLWNIPVESAVYIQSIIWSTIYQYSLWFIYQYRVLIFMYHYSLLSICCLYTSKVYFPMRRLIGKRRHLLGPPGSHTLGNGTIYWFHMVVTHLETEPSIDFTGKWHCRSTGSFVTEESSAAGCGDRANCDRAGNLYPVHSYFTSVTISAVWTLISHNFFYGYLNVFAL